MRKSVFFAACLPLLVCSCMTRIVTVSPGVAETGVYTTTVTVPKTSTITTTTRVMAFDEDISLFLDLQAVAAAFAQSSTVEEFEHILNNASYMLSNLDLNRDGYVDYLRVLETVKGRNHVFLLQAVLGANVYQDVASLVVELSGYSTMHVQVIGSTYLYGPNFIVQPDFILTPRILAHLDRRSYKPWISPWDWGHVPAYYKRPAPVYLSHYQAYVVTFMRNSHYCHKVTYPAKCHYPDYELVSRSYQRNDYAQQHPEHSLQRERQRL